MLEHRVRRAPASVRAAPVLAAAFIALAVAGCSPPGRELQPGTYRAVVDSPGGDLPFGLIVARDGRGVVMSLVNGEETLAATQVSVQDGRLSATLPGGRSTLDAKIAGDQVRGEVAFHASDGRTHPVPFKAIRGQAWRFFEEAATDNLDASGRWTVTLVDERGSRVRAVAEFRQKFERVTGTIRTATDEYRLAGEAHGDELLLSHFDGRAGHLFLAKSNRQGELEGDGWSLPGTHVRFVAVRSAAAEAATAAP